PQHGPSCRPQKRTSRACCDTSALCQYPCVGARSSLGPCVGGRLPGGLRSFSRNEKPLLRQALHPAGAAFCILDAIFPIFFMSVSVAPSFYLFEADPATPLRSFARSTRACFTPIMTRSNFPTARSRC